MTLPVHNADLGTNYNPTFTWKKVDNAIYYHLYVPGPAGVVKDQWYQSSAICNAVYLFGVRYHPRRWESCLVCPDLQLRRLRSLVSDDEF